MDSTSPTVTRTARRTSDATIAGFGFLFTFVKSTLVDCGLAGGGGPSPDSDLAHVRPAPAS